MDGKAKSVTALPPVYGRRSQKSHGLRANRGRLSPSALPRSSPTMLDTRPGELGTRGAYSVQPSRKLQALSRLNLSVARTGGEHRRFDRNIHQAGHTGCEHEVDN